MTPQLGFKEWQVVCDALAQGRQSILIRKGGIHEGRDGFSFAHEAFFLFPTRFHTSPAQIREGIVTELPEWEIGENVRITHYVKALKAVTLTDWSTVARLAPLHIYSESTVRERFEWAGKGMATSSLHVALVRVYALREPWNFPYSAQHGGCRSWISLPEITDENLQTMTPVITDDAFVALLQSTEVF